MPEMTPHIGLKKPLATETADISVINDNMNIIDSALGDLSAVPTVAKDAAGSITELFTNVSDGKAVVAAAITDKGVPTAASDTFSKMADNIEAIQTGTDTSDATALAGDILAPKTAYGAAGTKLTGTLVLSGSAGDADVLATKTYYNTDAKTKRAGTMVNRGAVTLTPGPTDVLIPAGYHNGSGKVPAVVVPAAKVLAGTTIAGTAGTMPDRSFAATGGGYTVGVETKVDGGGNLCVVPQEGYYKQEKNGVGYGSILVNDPDFIAANVRSGINVFGLVGTLIEGKRSASGTFTATSGTTQIISGLAFLPSLILAYPIGYDEVVVYYLPKNKTFVGSGSAAVTVYANVVLGGFQMNNVRHQVQYNWIAYE